MTDYGPAPIAGVTQPGASPAPTRRQPPRVVYETPPAAVHADLDVAAQVIEELASRQVSLHFEVDHQAGRVRVQVLDGEGSVMREIPARSLLDTLSGGGLLIDQHG